MSAPLFLVESLPAADEWTLDGPEGHHAANVQRLTAGEELILADGRGGTALALVLASGKGSLKIKIVSRGYAESPDPRLVVVQGLPKGDRGELAVQAMTETGVDEIIPWSAGRSVTVWKGDRGTKARDKWAATAREAAKQARRPWLPTIAPGALSTARVADRLRGEAAAFVLHEEATDRLSHVPLPAAGEIILVVGPEGGIAPTELDAFADAGARPVRLGDLVLRTSTAGVAALSVLSARLGRW
ncbi:16S rRNA (uracil(1498)-N(3))-methyltransferase [Catenuloplanes atrovinosus]|uniref:Ribosomal RNA small subunit methyltransferase E n=1 Tax=Catenuloplanes atrovinosus TaxID=137266 RepID=A0AAE4CD21_9ACTN|nr:16S rRNA (uracil(1498)-N(3))-methyltransferase [Catenuloplanes atrovinosus]MDR7278609.1 16S rRNA (uracil1498-N3)-methyltransferase [Catenuloplanes atrovinosus]